MDLLLALVLFNTVTNILIIIAIPFYIVYITTKRLEFVWRETFWMKRKYGIELLWWRYPKNGEWRTNSGRSLFALDFYPKVLADKNDWGDYQKQTTILGKSK